MVDRREVLNASAPVIVTLVLPAAAVAASGDGGTSTASLDISGTTASDGSVTVVWTDTA